jgi:hypothetical protein
MARERFTGLDLSDDDWNWIAAKKREQLSERRWKRLRMLELLGQGWLLRAVATAVGTYPREVRRVGWRAVEFGLEASLEDEPRPHPPRLLAPKDEAALTAMVCGPPPEGRARWTIRLIAEEAVRRAIVAKMGRDTARRFLASHDLKPWREKNVVRATDRRRVHREDGGRARGPRASS